jgi:prepilin-type N-terminal cleavage/methylation domain-containing protein
VRGVTLVELLVAMLIMAILLTLAVPMFSDMIDRYRLKGAAESVYEDLQYARAEAIKTSGSVYVAFQTGSNWCYGLKSGATCNCNTANDCALGGVEKVVSHTGFTGISLTTNFSSNDTGFEPVRGTSLDNGTITVTALNGKTVEVIVSTLGRVRICSDDTSDYPAC